MLTNCLGEEEVQEEVQGRRVVWRRSETTTSSRPTSRSFRNNHLVVRTADVDVDTDKSKSYTAGGGGI